MRDVTGLCSTAGARGRKDRRITGWGVAALGVLLAGGALGAPPRGAVPVFRQVAGEIRTVTVARGDNLVRLAVRAGVGWQTLAVQNDLTDPDRIYPGQELHIDTRRIVPAVVDDGWVVDVPAATLYVIEGGALASRLTVGLGRAHLPTPLGSFRVLFADTDPSWDLPDTIEEEMQREGEVVRRKAQPGAADALGRYWIQLSVWGYGIHDTPFLASLGRHLGYGCVRVGRPDMERLFKKAREGLRIEITYFPVKAAVTPDGTVWVEAHPDVYDLGSPDRDRVLLALQRQGVAPGRVDVAAVDRVLAAREGIARPVGGVAGPADESSPEETEQAQVAAPATWTCLDCPPGPDRRVTFQIAARAAIDLPNPFPIEIRNDAGVVVFRPPNVAQQIVHLEPGEARNFVWEIRDPTGQPLPPGSYTATIRFYGKNGGPLRSLDLPLWVGR